MYNNELSKVIANIYSTISCIVVGYMYNNILIREVGLYAQTATLGIVVGYM